MLKKLISPLTSPLSPGGKAVYRPLADFAASPTYNLQDLETADGGAEAEDSGYSAKDEEDVSAGRTTSYKDEIRVLLSYMAPLFVSQLVQRYCAVLGPVSAAGKFGPVPLAGAALANTSFNILFIAPTYGITSALDTLSTQAEGQKAKIRDLNMLYSLRVLLVLSGCMVLLVPLVFCIESIFILAHIDIEAARSAARYMQWSCLGLPGWIGYEVLRKYIQAQGKMFGPAVAGIIAAPVIIPLMHSTVFGVNTPPCALAVYFNLTFLAEVAWALLFLPKGTWSDIPSLKLVCQDLGVVCKLGAAGTVSACSDWWAWECLSFASAWLGGDVLAANGIFLTTASFWFALPGSLMNASATRVGNYLGRNAAENAKVAAFTSLGIGITVACTTATAVALNAKSWTSLYTDDPNVTEIVQKVMPFFCVIIALDAIQGSYGGILRGAGLPIQIARIMLSMHYLIGLPLATIFAFSSLRWGLLGLWGGFGVGLGLVCIRLTWLTVFNDWHEGARKAQMHIQASEQSARDAVAAEQF